MNMSQLRTQLGSEDSLKVDGSCVSVIRDGKVTDTYIMGIGGDLWRKESVSYPPAGHFRVTNLYVDKDTRKLVVEYDDTPAA